MVGQLAIVITDKPYHDQTKKLEHVLGTFSTINPAGQPGQWLRDRVPRHPRPGARRAGDPGRPVVRGRARSEGHRCRVPVWGPVAGLGGPSGPALNPARDLGPRIVHALASVEIQGQLAVVVFVGTGGGADRRGVGRGRDVHLAAGLRVRCGYRAAGETPAVQRSACPGLQPVAAGPFGAGTSMARNPSMLAALRCRQYSGKKASS